MNIGKLSGVFRKIKVFPLFSDDPRLCYSIREQICVGVWPKPKGFESKGYAKNLQIKSRCIDASKSFENDFHSVLNLEFLKR